MNSYHPGVQKIEGATEVLIVILVIAIIVTTVLGLLLQALDNSRQKRTMGDIKTLAAAVEAYSADNSHYVFERKCHKIEKK